MATLDMEAWLTCHCDGVIAAVFNMFDSEIQVLNCTNCKAMWYEVQAAGYDTITVMDCVDFAAFVRDELEVK